MVLLESSETNLYTRCTSKDTTAILALVLKVEFELRRFYHDFLVGFYQETAVLGGPWEVPGDPRKSQEVLGGPRKSQEVLGGPRTQREFVSPPKRGYQELIRYYDLTQHLLGFPCLFLGSPRSSLGNYESQQAEPLNKILMKIKKSQGSLVQLFQEFLKRNAQLCSPLAFLIQSRWGPVASGGVRISKQPCSSAPAPAPAWAVYQRLLAPTSQPYTLGLYQEFLGFLDFYYEFTMILLGNQNPRSSQEVFPAWAWTSLYTRCMSKATTSILARVLTVQVELRRFYQDFYWASTRKLEVLGGPWEVPGGSQEILGSPRKAQEGPGGPRKLVAVMAAMPDVLLHLSAHAALQMDRCEARAV